ncbi:MAG: alpha/beta fold hydrolase [Gemmatimonadaceae bacterium]
MTPALPPALVVHGALGSTAQMHPIVEALSASGRFAAVQAVELPGHGRTPTSVGFGMGPFTSALATAVRDVGFGRPVVFGYSMGGYVALLLEASAPGSLGGIVTLGTMLHWTPEVAARAASRLDPAPMRAKVPAFAEALEARHRGAGGWEQVVADTAALLTTLGAAPPLTDDALRAIACPVHLLVGSKDDTVTLEETTRAASHIPHARASLLDGVPHPIERVPPALIVRELTDLADFTTGG